MALPKAGFDWLEVLSIVVSDSRTRLDVVALSCVAPMLLAISSDPSSPLRPKCWRDISRKLVVAFFRKALGFVMSISFARIQGPIFAEALDFSSMLFATICIAMFPRATRGLPTDWTMKLYIAGPDVFRQDAAAWAEATRALCRGFGHQALIPLDGVETTAPGICHANFDLIRSADAVLANLNPFRGCEPDSGTCVEVGFALALNKPVVGYVASGETTVARVAAIAGGSLAKCNGRPVDADGLYVEDFGLPLNLMLAVPARIVVGGLAEALQALSG